jgi:hypothetical protein
MQHKKLQCDIASKNIGINHKGGGGKGKLEIKEKRRGMSMLVLLEENANI